MALAELLCSIEPPTIQMFNVQDSLNSTTNSPFNRQKHHPSVSLSEEQGAV